MLIFLIGIGIIGILPFHFYIISIFFLQRPLSDQAESVYVLRRRNSEQVMAVAMATLRLSAVSS